MNAKKFKKTLDEKTEDQLIEMTADVLDGLHEEVIELRDDEKYKQSLSLLDEMLSALRRDALGSDYDDWLIDTLYHKSEVLYALGRIKDSLKICEKILKVDPKNVETWYFKGWLLSDLNKHKEALMSYQKALKYEPNDKDTLINISHEFLELNRYDEALKFAKRCIRLDPKDDYAWHNFGEALHGTGQYRIALKAFEKSLKIDPKEDDAWYMKARCLAKLDGRNQDKAIDSLLVAISLNHENKSKARTEKNFLSLRRLKRFKNLLR